jgi:hypothetical protein
MKRKRGYTGAIAFGCHDRLGLVCLEMADEIYAATNVYACCC